ncbi:MAG: transporter substrate-binding domain-containing protein [Bacillota bacterium]
MKTKTVKIITLIILLSFLNITFGNNDLTNKEKQWINSQKTITLSPDPNYAPIEFLDENNKYKGIAADYIKWIENYSGLKIEVEVSKSWSNVLEKMENKKIDLIGALNITEKRKEYMIFSIPYISLENVIITSDEIKEKISINDLKNMKVAVMKDYAINDYIENNYPSINIVQVNSIKEGMQKTSLGLTDAFINEIGQISYYLENSNLTNLKISGTVNSISKISFGIRDDYKILKSIIDKSLLAMSDKRKTEIRNKWIINQPNTNLFMNFLQKYAIFIFLIFISIILINIYLSKKIKQKTKELHNKNKKLNELNNSLEQKVKKRTKQLEKKIKTLESTKNQLAESKKMALMNDLILALSNEINEPLGNIKTTIDFLNLSNEKFYKQIRKDELTKKDLIKYHIRIKENINILTSALRKTNKINKGFQNFEIHNKKKTDVSTDFQKIVKEIIKEYKFKYKKVNMTLKVNFDLKNKIINYPKKQIKFIIKKLIDNALFHAYSNEQEYYIELNIFESKNNIFIVLKDKGCGIKEEHIDKIFDPFFTTTRHRGSLGLNLFIVYNIIKNIFNGKIIVKSSSEGTTFKVSLTKKGLKS